MSIYPFLLISARPALEPMVEIGFFVADPHRFSFGGVFPVFFGPGAVERAGEPSLVTV